MDYQSNSKKSKEVSAENVVNLPPKNVERVVVTDVIVKKQGIGRKFKDMIIEADARSASRYVFAEVMLPAARNMLVDAVTKGMERLVWGETATRRRNFDRSSRISYNNIPVNRGFGGSPLPARDTSRTYAPTPSPAPRSLQYARNDLIISTKEEADLVLERMHDIIEKYDVVSVADLHEMLGLPTSHVDNKWGWSLLNDVQVLQIREGYVINLPPAEPIG